METPVQEITATAEQDTAAKGVQNTLGVIRVIEGLFNALKVGSYPLSVHEPVSAGMQFLAQFHSQLVGQLPPGLVDEMRKASQQPTVQTVDAPIKPEASNEPKA